jgi:hypothetical protein
MPKIEESLVEQFRGLADRFGDSARSQPVVLAALESALVAVEPFLAQPLDRAAIYKGLGVTEEEVWAAVN